MKDNLNFYYRSRYSVVTQSAFKLSKTNIEFHSTLTHPPLDSSLLDKFKLYHLTFLSISFRRYFSIIDKKTEGNASRLFLDANFCPRLRFNNNLKAFRTQGSFGINIIESSRSLAYQSIWFGDALRALCESCCDARNIAQLPRPQLKGSESWAFEHQPGCQTNVFHSTPLVKKTSVISLELRGWHQEAWLM